MSLSRLFSISIALMLLTATTSRAQESDLQTPRLGPPPAHLSVAEIQARFADPPARFRILKIIHNLPETDAAQDALLAGLARQHFGGLVTNIPFRQYLRSDAEWRVFTRGVTEAKKRGMAMWLYDERGYPSGNAGGLTMQGHPEWEARGLYYNDAVTPGGAVALDLPPGKLVRAAAFPLAAGAIDLDQGVDLAASVKDGKLAWTAPAGSWRVLAITEDSLYANTHAAVSLADKLPYINLLLPEPTAHFIGLTHKAYAAHLGPDLGKYFIATFTDEPSLMSMFMRQQSWRVVPWAAPLPREFKGRRGHDLAPLLPALFTNAGPRGAHARHDFWQTVGELVASNYFGQLRDWCRRHNVPSGGHLLLEEPLLSHVTCYGDLFRCERMLDAPSLDCLTSIPDQVHWFSARLVSSAGEIEDRIDNMCETSDHAQRYRPTGDNRPPVPVTEAQIRGTCNRLIVSGITGITSYYSFAGLNDEAIQRLNQWIGRCCATLYGGGQVTDVAVVYPIESVWPHFEPSRLWNNDAPEAAKNIEKAYRTAADQLFFNRRDFTFIDTRTLTEAVVEKGVLKYKDHAFRVVVLPAVDTLPLEAWENLARFWQGGGTLVAVGALPTNSESQFPSAAVQKIARVIFGEGGARRVKNNAAAGHGVYLPLADVGRLSAVLDALLDPEVKAGQGYRPTLATHRRIGGNEIFFLINDSDKPWSGAVSLAAAGKGERYDPATGAVTPLASPDGIDVKLGPYGAALFRFDQPKPPARREDTVKALQKVMDFK